MTSQVFFVHISINILVVETLTKLSIMLSLKHPRNSCLIASNILPANQILRPKNSMAGFITARTSLLIPIIFVAITIYFIGVS